MTLPDGAPEALTPDGVRALSVSPDGQRVAALDPQHGVSLWPVDGGPPQYVAGSKPGDRPVAWTADGRALWVYHRGEVPTQVDLLEIASGRRQPWKRLVPPDPAGMYSIDQFRVTPSGHAYFYSYRRVLSELYQGSGLR